MIPQIRDKRLEASGVESVWGEVSQESPNNLQKSLNYANMTTGCKHVYFFRQPSSTHVNTCQRNAFDATFGRRDAHPPAPWRCTPESHTQPGRSEQSSIFLDLAGSPHEHTNFTVYKREGADVTTSGFGFCMAAVGFRTPLLIGRE